MLGRVLRGLLILVVFGVLIWLSDRVTLQGERTVFTVKCEHGAWQGSHCTGKLVPGERYAFRASPRRHTSSSSDEVWAHGIPPLNRCVA